ncbi:MAG: hypothetical protein JO079_09650 [Frankiaceae bacterium]|nr:hypothetical protein [Frankiaceae bacterium]
MRNTPKTTTSAALAALVDALGETIEDLEELVTRAALLRAELDAGEALSEVMPREQRPLIIGKLVEVTDRLHAAGGAVRRAEALQLRSEGCTQEQIAEIFGVTRQRVAKLLDSPMVKPAAKRPRR